MASQCIKINEVSPLFPTGSHINYWIHEVYLSLVLKKIIEQLWLLLEVDIQFANPWQVVFPRGSPRGKQPLSSWQIWMSTSNKGHNCILFPNSDWWHMNHLDSCLLVQRRKKFIASTVKSVSANSSRDQFLCLE